MKEDEEKDVQRLHSERNFLALENTKWDGSTCVSYVYLDDDKDGIALEAEISISDGNDTVNFDGSYEDRYDNHLAVVTKLRDQIISYVAAYERALAQVRSQSITES